MACGADVNFDVVGGHDVGGAEHALDGLHVKRNVVQLARFGVDHESDVVGLVGAGQPQRALDIAVGQGDVFGQVEAEDVGEDVEHFVDVGAVQQAVVQAHRRNAFVELGHVGLGIFLASSLPTNFLWA